MAGPQEARVAAGVHVEQIAGAGPLIAVGWLSAPWLAARDPRPLEHLPDGRVREPGRSSDQPRTPTGLAAASTDPLLQLGREQPRRAARPARAIKQRACQTITVEPAMP